MAKQPDMPNIVFITGDQHNADCLGFMGRRKVHTPHLDDLAARSAYFSNMFTCAPICGPSRTSFYTGTFARTHENMFMCSDLRRDFASLTSELGRAGYTRALVGKGHLPGRIAEHFDHHVGPEQYGTHLAEKGLERNPHGPVVNKNFQSFTSPLPEEDTWAGWTARQAREFLRSDRAAESPFFLACSFGPPHAPHCPPERFEKMYDPDDVAVDWEAYERFENSRMQNRPNIEDFWKLGSVRHDPSIFQKAVCRYLALVSQVDHEVGRLLELLEETGRADNTIVIYTSDHGDFAGNYGQLGKNLPGYDDLLRIPFIYHDPAREADAGREVNGLHQTVDVFPTLLRRIGLEVPPTVQGRSLIPALDGHPGCSRDFIFAETTMEKTIRSRDWKLNFCVRQPDRGQLFRMGACPDETTNLWSDPDLAHVRQRMMQQLTAWMVRCEQPVVMCSTWEEHADTRWYRWLQHQPRQAEFPETQR
jgi:uncharacterized sulfatase